MFARTTLVLISAGVAFAAQAATVSGTYQEVVSGTCLYSQAGFNSTYGANLVDGMPVFTIPYVFRGKATFNPHNGTGTFSGVGVSTNSGIVYGDPPAHFFSGIVGSQERAFAYTVATDSGGNAVLTVTPNKKGISGTSTNGASYVINNPTAEQGAISSTGIIVMTATPGVITDVITMNGSPTKYAAFCSETETLTPLP